ncbi:MAG: helix-turn-helix domain-containing protein [Clostridia bacterium]|nr:helix-turn-helix domain-containing protein [Clostridia bacterium]
MEIYNINPNIRYAREHNNFKGARYTSKCYDCRIFYICSGEGRVIANGKKYNFSTNYIIFFPPRTEYRFIIDSDEQISVQVFNFDLIDEYFRDLKHLGTPKKDEFDEAKVPEYKLPKEFGHIIVREDFFDINELLGDCIDIFISKPKYYKEIASSILKKSLLMLLTEENSLGKNNKLIASVLEYISKNYADFSLSNQMIAAQFNYHSYYLNRLMKNFTGKTIHQYIIYYRLRVAKDMLITTDDDVSTIAWKVGFNSPSHFINTFHLRFGRTPYEYRQIHAAFE